jgi:hypothetical protein
MKYEECPFEVEVLAGVVKDPDLLAHIKSCAVCSEAATLMQAFDAARDRSRAEAPIPDAGQIWWRAQLRARREAVRTAGRPIAIAQVFALVCAAVLLASFFGAAAGWFQAAASKMTLFTEHWPLIATMAALVLLVPTAVYFALGRD